MIARRVIFEGRVQGVGFRYTTKDIAKGFEVCGSVKNLPDGTVELDVMGEREEVEAFINEIAEESALAHHIKGMHVKNIPPLEGVKGFTIER
ncbi:acylphosphatase [Luteolibacter arcticus]|uniref:acylphosphatase n=1 Tax=Luteolibacter arcticus TaxID=1581411 RepID=A0ABT3GHB8_9BACT|nr:acylphosphatase [Luteolibacter arcticus]MCW1923012.1 acylphosphatase [Luteolibacter arcticus]